MDEESNIAECPWPVEDIPNDHFVSRHFSEGRLKNREGRRFPSEADFKVQYHEDGLSMYWDKYINLKDIYSIIGLSYDFKGEFKKYKSFQIFRFQVAFIRNLQQDLSVTHSPAYYGNPSPVGLPNNRSHSLMNFNNAAEEDILEIRANLSDHCIQNHKDCFRPFDADSIAEEIEILRSKKNDTIFHRH